MLTSLKPEPTNSGKALGCLAIKCWIVHVRVLRRSFILMQMRNPDNRSSVMKPDMKMDNIGTGCYSRELYQHLALAEEHLTT